MPGFGARGSSVVSSYMAMGQNPVPPVNIPIPTKIRSKMGGEFTYQPTWDPKTVLTTTVTCEFAAEFAARSPFGPRLGGSKPLTASCASDPMAGWKLTATHLGRGTSSAARPGYDPLWLVSTNHLPSTPLSRNQDQEEEITKSPVAMGKNGTL